MLSGRFVNQEPDADDTDEYWLERGYISIVPVSTDQTAHDAIKPLTVRMAELNK